MQPMFHFLIEKMNLREKINLLNKHTLMKKKMYSYYPSQQETLLNSNHFN